MADYSRPTDWKFEALKVARDQYDEWQKWEEIVDDGWLALADYTVCTWCSVMVYPSLKELHRTKCKKSLEPDVPEPVRYETVKEYQLDIPWRERSDFNRRLYPY